MRFPDQICFTTEIVTSGTLKQYVNRVRNVKLKVIKKVRRYKRRGDRCCGKAILRGLISLLCCV